MKVDAVQNDRRHSILGPMGTGAAIGAASGFVLKYAYPVTSDEKSTDEYIKVMNKINKQKTEYNLKTVKFVNSIKNKDRMSLAEDEFVKMFDGLKEGDHVGHSRIRKAIKNIEKKNPNEVLEFKRVCKASSNVIEKTAKQCVNAYNIVTKHIRPTSFFLISGAVVGAIIAAINDILKTEVKN